MNELLEFLTRHGPFVIFLVVFIEQIGVPLPAAPWLLTAGALAGGERLNGVSALAAGVGGCLAADVILFYLGRHHGRRVLSWICRVSLEQDACVRRTHDVFTRYGMRGVIAAKFIPGLSSLAPASAGNSGVSVGRFFLFDGLGSSLYIGCFVLGGVLFSEQLEQILNLLANLGHGALALLVALVASYLGYRYYRRRKLLLELRMARITVEELHRKLQAGENPLILDLRSISELERDPLLIRGARHIAIEELQHRSGEIPRDRDVVVYCACPDEESSARAALVLHRSGITRVHPLLGGFDAWRERNYPTESQIAQVSNFATAGI